MARKKKKKNRLILTLFLEIVIILLLVAGFFMYNKLNLLQRNNSKDQEIQQNEKVKTTGYRNIALFGVDSRQNELKISTHSDTIIIASINKATKDVKMVSVYRDTYVKIPDKMHMIRLMQLISEAVIP
jgi:anionic cell wall polymer biosynthesis LytR-Cps2A-Psr (LCP) family protein